MNDDKDRLLAWAYRWFAENTAVDGNGGLGKTSGYPSRSIEFFHAASTVLPGVAEMAASVPYHADQILPARDADEVLH